MLLQDIIEKRLIEAYRKDKTIAKSKVRINFNQIRLTEMYQKINDQAEAKASANAIAFNFMDKEKKKNFYAFHSNNILVSKDPEKEDCYNLICGLIAYKTLDKVFTERKRKYDAKLKAAGTDKPYREPSVRVTVINYETRHDFIAALKDYYDLSFRVDPGYLKIDDKQEFEQENVADEIIKLSEDTSYDLPVDVIEVDGALYPVSNVEYAVAVKRYNESVDDNKKKESVFVHLQSQ